MTSSCALIDQCDDEISGYRGDRLVERCSGKRDRATCWGGVNRVVNTTTVYLRIYLLMVYLMMLLLVGSSGLTDSLDPLPKIIQTCGKLKQILL